MRLVWSAEEEAVARTAARQTILVVDDDADIREILAEILESEGYPVAQARNGQEALDYLRQADPPCLILLDLMMPVMDGWAFLDAHDADPELARIPVVVCSASVNLRGQAPVAREFLPKPVSAERLFSTIDRLCG